MEQIKRVSARRRPRRRESRPRRGPSRPCSPARTHGRASRRSWANAARPSAAADPPARGHRHPQPRARTAGRADRRRRPVVALTGAGISVPSGIPDFRSPGTGLWENVDPMEVAHIDAFVRDPSAFWGFYAARFATLEGKRPNGAHLALVRMERAGLLARRDHPERRHAASPRGHPRAGRGPRLDRDLLVLGLRRAGRAWGRPCPPGRTADGVPAANLHARCARTWCCSARCSRARPWSEPARALPRRRAAAVHRLLAGGPPGRLAAGARPTAPGARSRSSPRAPRHSTRSPRCASKETSSWCSRRSPRSSGCRLSVAPQRARPLPAQPLARGLAPAEAAAGAPGSRHSVSPRPRPASAETSAPCRPPAGRRRAVGVGGRVVARAGGGQDRVADGARPRQRPQPGQRRHHLCVDRVQHHQRALVSRTTSEPSWVASS